MPGSIFGVFVNLGIKFIQKPTSLPPDKVLVESKGFSGGSRSKLGANLGGLSAKFSHAALAYICDKAVTLPPFVAHQVGTCKKEARHTLL